MMIKYRVREVAKDLDIPNKEVIDTLAEYFTEPKKYMTVLTEEELDIVFETFTQKRNLETLDTYFAEREQAQPEPEITVEAEPVSEEPKKAVPEQKDSPAEKKAPAAKPGEKAPVRPAAEGKPKPQEKAAPAPVVEHSQPVRRVIDTRSSNVNIDRYNEKYDRLADQKVKTDNVVTKQKFMSRNQQRRGQQRRGKRETEAERLRRIA